MKLFIAALACAALSAEARRSPKVKYDTCISSGDPHYTPFTGKKDKFTMMGEGEFKLVDKVGFKVHTCQEDVSKDNRKGTMKAKTITWNKHVVAQEASTKVEVQVDGTVKISNTVSKTEEVFQKVFKKGSKFTTGTKNSAVIVSKPNKNKAVVQIKFMSGRSLTVRHYKKSGGRLGTREFLNVNIRAERNEKGETSSGLCYEKKKNKITHSVAVEDSLFDAACGAAKVAVEVDTLVEVAKSCKECPKLCASAFKKCGNNKGDNAFCVYDIVTGCDKTTDGNDEADKQIDEEQAAQEKEDMEEDAREFTCPANSYVSASATYPLLSFDDCDCQWGFKKSDDGETCVRKTNEGTDGKQIVEDNSVKNPSRCFCEPDAPAHCMQTSKGDSSCGLPVYADGKTPCDKNAADPFDKSKCVCPVGTMDCSAKDYSIRELRAPAAAVPGRAFAQQPVFALFNGDSIEQGQANDEKMFFKISIANVQPEKCQCAGDKPCLHNNPADNTCFAKQELFGEQVCPAGTTECIAEESKVQLYRNDPENKLKDQQCRHGEIDPKSPNNPRIAHTSSSTAFCSGETPCKQINDGTCMPKQTFKRPVVDEKGNIDAPRPTEYCGIDFWRRATPSPLRNWFFETDSTCNMDADGTLGCTDKTHRYAMDKWCDVNCQPEKYGRKGQPAFCPKSHCDLCQEPAETPEVPEKGWRCPLDQYKDGSCFCSAGTEHCGSIIVEAVNGVVEFDSLTIGVAGKYQLLVELVQTDSNTGSGMQLTATSSVFQVANPSSGAECRAQDQWRQDDLDKSPVHGAGKSWFFQDSTVKCGAYNPDGSCKPAVSKREYAMDKWCKANRCAEFTLETHCTKEATESYPVVSCDNNIFDLFGECCRSGRVDQCGVCDGDGSTCELSHYLSTFADEIAPEVVDQLKDAALKNRHCPVFAPCAHINEGDESCVPKTYASKDLVNEEFKYCPYDSAEGDWQKGTWDDENGKQSQLVGTLEKGNKDCFCPRGTVDLTGKAKVEKKMEDEFVAKAKATCGATIKRITDKMEKGAISVEETKELTEARITQKTQENKVEIFDTKCGGAKQNEAPSGNVGSVKIEDAKNHPLCAHEFKLANGDKKQITKGSCKCIAIPPRVTVTTFAQVEITKLTTVDLSETTARRFVNDGDVTKFVNLNDEESKSIEQVRVGGDIIKAQAELLGTPTQAGVADCKQILKSELVELKDGIEQLVTCTKNGGGIDGCIATASFSDDVRELANQFVTCFSRSDAVASARAVAAKPVNFVTSAVSSLTTGFAKRFGFRRLAGASATVSTGTQFVGRVGTSGNTGLAGGAGGTQGTSFATSVRTGTGQGAGSFGGTPLRPNLTGGASSGGLSAGMTALVALASVGALVGAAVGVKKYRDGFEASKPESSSLEMTPGSSSNAKEDCTDVL